MSIENILLPPNDIELEKLALSMCYTYPETISKLDANCFYIEDYKKLYISMNKTKSSDVSVLSVDSGISNDKIFDYISELVSANSLDYICTEIFKYKNARTLVRGISKLESQARGLDIEGARTTLDKIQTILQDIEEDGTLSDQTISYFESISDEKKTITSGFNSVDEVITLYGGQLVIVAGRPGMGKTTVMLNCAVRQSKDKNVGFISMEMSLHQIIDRILCIMSGLTSWDIKNKKHNIDKITEYLGKLLQNKLFLAEKIYTIPKIEQHIVKNKLDVCYIDYLGLINHGSSSMRVIDRISEITRQLKMIAGKHNVNIVLGCQLSRGVENRNDQRPVLSDLRDSGSIEQDADIVAMLYREDYYDEGTERKNIIDILIRKNREGETKDIPMGCHLSKYRITDLQSF